MKFLVVAVFVAICGSVLGRNAYFDDHFKQCSEKHNINQEQVRSCMNGKIDEADATEDMKCFFLCMGEKQNIIKDGAFQPQVFAQNVNGFGDKEQVKKITNECNLKGIDDCDTAFKVSTCLGKHMDWNDIRKN